MEMLSEMMAKAGVVALEEPFVGSCNVQAVLVNDLSNQRP